MSPMTWSRIAAILMLMIWIKKVAADPIRRPRQEYSLLLPSLALPPDTIHLLVVYAHLVGEFSPNPANAALITAAPLGATLFSTTLPSTTLAKFASLLPSHLVCCILLNLAHGTTAVHLNRQDRAGR